MSTKCKYPGCTNDRTNSLDEELCFFHASIEKKDLSGNFLEDQIKFKLVNHDYNFEGYIFPSEINFTNLIHLPQKQFRNDVNFKKCIFLNFVNFGGIKFLNNVDFYGTLFKETAIFELCDFLKPADFNNCIFEAQSHFIGAHFYDSSDFQDSKFHHESFFERLICDKESNFNRTSFKDLANFNHALFNDQAHFQNTKFLGVSDFQDAHFFNQAYFNKSTFKNSADFNDAIFEKSATFEGSEFNGIVEFIKVKILLHARFKNCIFNKANFNSLIVNGRTFFKDSIFEGETSFEGSQLHQESFFQNTVFKEILKFNFSEVHSIDFQSGEFKGDSSFYKFKVEKECNFQNIKTWKTFSLEKAVFNENFILNNSHICGNINFVLTIFNGNIFFNSNIFYSETDIIFEEISLSENTNFYFKSPKFIENNDLLNVSTIKFLKIQFNPHKTYFDNFKYKINQLELPSGIVLFRFCNLKDVFFTDNNMIYFSFYKSIFDEARFISNDWPELKKRKNIVVDEFLITKSKENDGIKTKFELWGNKSFNTIASIYSRLKTASDDIKSYTEASLFYYNEFEMRRKYFLESKNKKFAFLYWLYKFFVGYGEKPLRSFISLLFFGLIIFPSIHILTGLNVRGTIFNYDLDISNYSIFINSAFLNDFLYSVGFSLYRVIPVGYLPFERMSITPLGPDGLLFSFLNSFVSILLLIFTGIGLKRHFKRF